MELIKFRRCNPPNKYEEEKENACENSGISAFEQFVGADKLSKRANNAEVLIKDYKLTRYACYLIAQNGDPRKEVISLAQTYFAIQTRKQKISEKENKKSLVIQ